MKVYFPPIKDNAKSNLDPILNKPTYPKHIIARNDFFRLSGLVLTIPIVIPPAHDKAIKSIIPTASLSTLIPSYIYILMLLYI